MSMFNSDQSAHMEYLESIPPENRCWCGWYKLGKCDKCAPGKTLADKLAAQCEICGAAPGSRGEFATVHRTGCARQGSPHREEVKP
jgi:hypothetical protein